MELNFKKIKKRINPRGVILELIDFVNSNKHYKHSKTLFSHVRVFAMFIGYPRSGSSLVGSLLDAHPNIIISHELDVIKYLELGLSRDRIFSLIMSNSKRHATTGRRVGGYDNLVPGQWQGKFKKLICIGDKKAAKTAERLGTNPKLISKIKTNVGKQIKFIHVVRNPYDNITTICMRGGYSLLKAIDQYFKWVKYVCEIKQVLPETSFLTVKHESLIENPTKTLISLCYYLGQGGYIPQDYLNACSRLIFKSPQKTRHKISWDKDLINKVKKYIYAASADFLNNYSYNE